MAARRGNESPRDKTPKGHSRRDALLEIEVKQQVRWEAAKLFEADAPAADSKEYEEKSKFLATFPYPYMNGRLHLGHVLTVTKADFAVGFFRMIGKNSLFPFAFHCTGMPIQASATRLKTEIDTYGVDSNGSIRRDGVSPDCAAVASVPASATDAAGGKKFVAKKSKVSAKSGNAKLQWDILVGSGVDESEIPRFVDPVYWTSYFPKFAIDDLKRFGVKVDWRRSFITTELNPYYDSFIRWQFEKLKSQGRVRYGKRFTIYSPRDGQACADHDRASGEGVQPQEYVAIKLTLQKPYPKEIDVLGIDPSRRIVFLCATLRPETMFGQTNFWVLPGAKYGVFDFHVDSEVYICSAFSALNLSYQGVVSDLLQTTSYEMIGDVKGDALVGCMAVGPLMDRQIRALPLLTISMKKGTGVVTCVPTDAPDDWMMLEELKKNPQMRKKYGIADEWVVPLEYVEILETKYGRRSAEAVIREMGITSISEKLALQKAKEIVYREGFYKGKMIVPGYEGRNVFEVKDEIRQKLLDSGDALLCVLPESEVISRSGQECVVALMDQWYIPYGEGSWKDSVLEHIAEMEMYAKETKDAMRRAVEWLKQWACSRSFGLGTKLPWDTKYVIESLSDSTIYMAFYTFAHLLQGIDNLRGTKPGPAGILPEQCTPAVWDYIFLGIEPEDFSKLGKTAEGIPATVLQQFRSEYLYWYPIDVRVSGKDLIQNHLVFWIYNHLAVLGKAASPRGMRTNGFLMLNNEKMSKQTGNFLSLAGAVEKFGADATRVGLADAGDGVDDANFAEETANAAVLKLTNLIKFARDFTALEGAEPAEESDFHTRVFENSINQSILRSRVAYERLLFRDALRCGFFDLMNARDNYRAAVGGIEKMNRRVTRRYLEVQALLIAPIASHVAEHVWSEILHQEGTVPSVLVTSFPVAGAIDRPLYRVSSYLDSVVSATRKKILRENQLALKFARRKKTLPRPSPNRTTFYVSRLFPNWHATLRRMMGEQFAATGELLSDDQVLALLKSTSELKGHVQEAMVAYLAAKEEVPNLGVNAFDLRMPFDEVEILRQHARYVAKALEMAQIDVELINTETCEKDGRKELAQPGAPSSYFFFVEN